MKNWITFIKNKFSRSSSDHSLRETLEELIEENQEVSPSLAPDEREMLTNILKLRDLTAKDVMIPRADIIAVPVSSTLDEVKKAFKTSHVMRLPVYRSSLDDVLGYIHIRDLMDAQADSFKLSKHTHKIDFIAPSMRVLDLLIQMRSTGEKLALVVDEYGGIDGLVTIGDVVEEIVGDIQQVATETRTLQFFRRPDGVIVVDGRISIEDLETKIGKFMTDEDREEDIETIGGLIFHLADRVPQRGELISHPSGIEFEIIEADLRRIKRIGIHRTKSSTGQDK